ncbi:MAG: nucleoside deaminase [Elusimicrobiaceae bacterium]|nr:nucleoside deaminase [Elusimicrobiaceae bacterium]
MNKLTEHEKFLEMAIKLAEKSAKSGKGGPFGAVIVKDGKVIAKAYNTVTPSKDPTAHAEVNAIRKACKKLKDFQLDGCTIYASAEPCPMCFGAIYWARPKALFYAAEKQIAARAGFDDSFIYKEIAKPQEKRKIKIHHLALKNASLPFKIWMNKQDKVEY